MDRVSRAPNMDKNVPVHEAKMSAYIFGYIFVHITFTLAFAFRWSFFSSLHVRKQLTSFQWCLTFASRFFSPHSAIHSRSQFCLQSKEKRTTPAIAIGDVMNVTIWMCLYVCVCMFARPLACQRIFISALLSIVYDIGCFLSGWKYIFANRYQFWLYFNSITFTIFIPATHIISLYLHSLRTRLYVIGIVVCITTV